MTSIQGLLVGDSDARIRDCFSTSQQKVLIRMLSQVS
jgi:hypothetical protein